MAEKTTAQIVTTPLALAEVCERLASAGSFGFDTEFVGEDNYQPEICLLQVATVSFCAVIDPLADLDLAPFWELVAGDAHHVIVHAGHEEVAQCWKRTGRPAAGVFDLQVAAGLVGMGYPSSLPRLARVTIGARIHKSQTLTDWRSRPLTREQIDYAAEDVVHLPAMCRFIRGRLVEMGREEWAIEECRRMCQAATLTAKGEQKLRRLRGAASLDRRELAIADALLEERDRLSQEYDRPPRGVLRDHLLVELARRGWTDVRRIRSLRGVSLKPAAVRRLAAAIENASKLPEDQWPSLPPEEDSREEEVLRHLLAAVLRDHCNHAEIAHALLASKQDVRALIRTYTRAEKPELPILLKTGWRRTAVGDLLDRILSGRSSVRLGRKDEEHRLIIS